MQTFWHTSAHILAQAVLRLYPSAKLGVGPATENGFYYDLKLEKPLSPEDLPKIEAECKKIAKENLRVERKEISYEEARVLFADQSFKLELIDDYEKDGRELTVYTQGEFSDLCAGPHLNYTSKVKALAVTAATAAYWRGDAANDSLTRIYGVSFPNKEHKKIAKENLRVERKEISYEEARALFADQPFKLELIDDYEKEGRELTVYTQGEFSDLCAGPHLNYTSKVKALAVTAATAAYWRGDAANDSLTRIYGVSFPNKDQLAKHLEAVEEAKKRDHNVLGRQLGYFTTSEPVGQGLPLLMPKGAKVMQTLMRFVEDEAEARGYQLTRTPIMAKSDLYKISGHWDHYRDGMFVIDEQSSDDILALRPMTCPFQFMIYKSGMHSYKELPIRYVENSTLCRNESSGEMHGLIRVRQFTLSDAHTIVTPEQLEDEFGFALSFIKYIMKCIGIENDITYRFSKWDSEDREKYIDKPAEWEDTQDKMRKILQRLELDFTEANGEAAFYGPKLDIQMKNVFGKEDTLITLQIDFALAERFDMEYVDADNTKKRPYILHHSIIGCFERTLAILIEKYAGDLPLWIAPEQARILPIGDSQVEYAQELLSKLKMAGISATLDSRNEKVGYKIREGTLEKIPYLLIVGEKEQTENTVSVRSRKHGESVLSVDELVEKIITEIKEKS
jgi:threonyl-tRNA synthetase